MSNLVQTLLSIKSSYDSFIDRPELIQGYTEDEIKQIEQKYDFPIHGQFKEFLMTMGKCSGGLVTGSDIYIYIETRKNYHFSKNFAKEIQNDPDCQEFIQNMGNIDLVEKKYFEFAGVNDHRFKYFMLLDNIDDIIYEWDTHEDIVENFGTLFDFLIWHRESIYRTVVENPKYPMYGRLL